MMIYGRFKEEGEYVDSENNDICLIEMVDIDDGFEGFLFVCGF